jgi:hypothetical protein
MNWKRCGKKWLWDDWGYFHTFSREADENYDETSA